MTRPASDESYWRAVGVSCAQKAISGSSVRHVVKYPNRRVSMSVTMTPEGESVHFPHLARQLGLTDRQRSELLRERLVTPVNGSSRRGSPTLITPESAQNLRDARRILQWMRANGRDIAAITIIVILRLLVSGAMTPNVPDEPQ